MTDKRNKISKRIDLLNSHKKWNEAQKRLEKSPDQILDESLQNIDIRSLPK